MRVTRELNAKVRKMIREDKNWPRCLWCGGRLKPAHRILRETEPQPHDIVIGSIEAVFYDPNGTREVIQGNMRRMEPVFNKRIEMVPYVLRGCSGYGHFDGRAHFDKLRCCEAFAAAAAKAGYRNQKMIKAHVNDREADD